MRAEESLRHVSHPSFPSGFQPDTRYASQRGILHSGGRLFVCSDGVYEVRSSTEETWGPAPPESVLRDVKDAPLPESVACAIDATRRWHQREHAPDDAALLGLDVAD